MKKYSAGLIAALSFLVAAAPASAFTLWAVSDHFTTLFPIYPVGTKLKVELYLDADQPGIQLLGIGVLFDSSVLQYNPKLNASVGVPSYVLYGMSGMMSTALYAQQDPFELWPGATPPGTGQVNVNWADATFAGTHVTGFGLKIAELEFEVVGFGDGIGEINVSLSAGGNIFQVNFDPNAPIQVHYTPEPTAIVLLGLGLAALVAAKRRAPRI